MITIIYQHISSGAIHEVSSLVTNAVWSTKRAGAPAVLELTLKEHHDVVWDPGGTVSVRHNAVDTLPSDNGGIGLFRGFVFRAVKNGDGTTFITAYDQLRYFKNKDTYVFEGLRADQIVSRLAADFAVNTATLSNTGYVIPLMVEDNQSLLDIIQKALDLTLAASGHRFFLWDDFGLLRLDDTKNSRLDLFLGDLSLATGFTYSVDTDTQTYNTVKLIKDSKSAGGRDVYTVSDHGNIRRWGVLQYFERADKELNPAQLKERGDMLLNLYNRPRQSLNISAVADLSVRAGRSLFAELKNAGISGEFIVNEARHNLLKGVMSLSLEENI